MSGSANVNPTTFGPRADLWLFPFMNVFVTGGGLKLNVQTTGLDIPLAITKVPPQVIRGDVSFNLDFTGYYGGGGIVLMYAFQNFFVSGDYSAVWTHLGSSTSGVEGNGLRRTPRPSGSATTPALSSLISAPAGSRSSTTLRERLTGPTAPR